MKTRAPVISSILAGLGLLAGPVVARPKALAASSLIETLDGDNDWTLNLDEVTKAASAVYDRLEKDQDSTWIARRSRARFAEAD